jgi:hypothetical protein
MMRNKKVAILVVAVLVVVLVVVCIATAPTLMDTIRSIYPIPQH